MRLQWGLSFIPFLLLSACASGPSFDSAGIDRSLTPRSIIAEPQMTRGKPVLWGGSIIHTTNLKDHTQLEVLAYPLDSNERPQSESEPLGRFIIEQNGYLEPESYAEGRQVTVVGTVNGVRIGRVGESKYLFPVVGARQVHLWPVERSGSGVSFGVGVGTWF